MLQTGSYILAHADLHWDSSEHFVNGKKWNLEIQMNHFDLSFDSFEEALNVPGATLSLGLFFAVSTEPSSLIWCSLTYTSTMPSTNFAL